MKKIKDYINNNVLLKIASFNSVAIVVRVASGLLTSKAIAVYVGAEGMALVGNLRNFLTIVESFTTIGFNNGIVKYIAEFKTEASKLSKVVSTILISFIATSVVVALLCYFNAVAINNYIFTAKYDYAYVIKIMAFTLPFHAVNVFFISVLNGLSKHKLYVKINIFGQIIAVFSTLFLIWKGHIDGALIAIVVVPVALFLVLFSGFFEFKRFFKPLKIGAFNIGAFKHLSSFSLMALFSSIMIPTVMIAIRNYLIDNIGQKEAGFWEAMLRISNYYLMFISTLMTLYLLPKFSSIHTNKEFRDEVFKFYKQIIPVFAVGLIVIYFLRTLIIQIVFTDELLPVKELFFWQLLGDFVKVLSMVIAYQFLAKKMIWHYLITEIISIAVLYGLSIYFIDVYGLGGAPMAHFVTYVIYAAMIIFLFRKSLFGNPR